MRPKKYSFVSGAPPGWELFTIPPGRNQENFFFFISNNEILLCMYQWDMHYDVSRFISHVLCEKVIMYELGYRKNVYQAYHNP